MLYLILTIFIILLLVMVYSKNSNEYYGTMKDLRRVPKTNCRDSCSHYYNDCMARYQHIDSEACAGRYRNCVTQCNYTDFHRM